MNETELAKLVVRLVGDGREYLDMLKTAEKETKETAGKIEQLGTALAGFMGSLGMKEFLSEAKGEWENAETALFRLTAVVKANGRDVGDLTARYADFATEVQKATVHSDEFILGLLRTAETFDLTGKAAERATKNALALSAAGDIGADSAMQMVQAVEQGNLRRAMMYSRRISQLRGEKDEHQFLQKYERLIASGKQTMADELGTGEGRRRNFENQWSDMMEEVGKSYSKAANPMKMFKREAMDVWKDMPEGARNSAVAIAGWATNVALAVTAVTALDTLLPKLKANLATVASSRWTWAAVAVVAVANLTDALLRSTRAAKELDAALAGLESAGKRYQGAVREAYADRTTRAGGRRSDMDRVRRDAERGLADARRALGAVESSEPGWGVRAVNTISGTVGGPQSDDYTTYKRLLEEAKNDVKAWQDALDGVTDAMDKAFGGRFAAKALEDMAEKLEEERKALGRTADEVGRYELALKGATKAQQDILKGLQQQAQAGKIYQAAADEIKNLREELETMGMSAPDKAVYRLRVQLDELRRQAREDGGRNPNLKSDIEDVQRKIRDAQGLAAAVEAAQIKEGQRSKEDRMLDFEARMADLLARRLLTQQEVNRAIEEEREKIFGLMAPLQAASAAWSGAHRAKTFQDFFRPDRNVGRPPNGVVPPGGDGGPAGGGANPAAVAAATAVPIVSAIQTLQEALTANGVKFVTVEAAG